MATERLFVYGSLKRGGLHHDELGGAQFLGEARTAPGYALVPITVGGGAGAPPIQDNYVALVERHDAGSVLGELFEVDEALLPRLDEFEGQDYERRRIPLAATEIAAESALALAYMQRTR